MSTRTSPNQHWDDEAYRQGYTNIRWDNDVAMLPYTRYRCGGCSRVFPSDKLRHESGGAWCPKCGGGSFAEVGDDE